MGKKKKRKKFQQEKKQPEKRGKAGYWIAGLLIAGILAWVLLGKGSQSSGVDDIEDYMLSETREILDPGLFTGRVAEAYQIARDHPKLIDQFFCYCYCKQYHGHKTLLTCFTDTHAARCDVCLYQAIKAKEMFDQGSSIDDIRQFFFARLRKNF